MATGGQSSQDVNPKLSLTSAGMVPIPSPVQEQTEHVSSPLALGNTTNTCFVSGQVLHRPAMERDTTTCCEVIKGEFKRFETQMNTKIDSMKSELDHKSLQIERLVQDRDQIRGEMDNLKVELNHAEREKNLVKREHQIELQEKNDEIKRLRDLNKDLTDRNQKLETQVKDLTEDKRRLEECIQNHTYELQTLQSKLDNMKNHNAQEIDELKAALETNQHQCNHGPESMAALEARMMQAVTEKMTLLMSNNFGTRDRPEQYLSRSRVDKVMGSYKSGGSSKSTTPLSTSPANSDHSSKPPTPPPENSDQIPSN